ncbi:thiamine pyrophosphate-dependent enzyme [Pontiella sulfatireligans]|uniref:Thiamine pyrophosphate-containing protein YdaP n=1 Tax=Pontiella sulfatireligans TaxID=2750658 RepID=A0A6C2ULE9_9BACT|nr:thiamine pyrophosphate-dependent enzyme [Pontiella sulfatireligans]VGO21072.1 Putative thiamine pyrophosphate-containing protein YdaP [Pontiella sulfatireligans]
MAWKCNVCGYIHEGDAPPEICPVCGVPASEFTEIPSSEEPAEESAVEQNVSDVMVQTMINWGVTHVFGMVGHSNLGLADAIRKQCEAGKLHYIGIRHEGAASFAASAFGKLTGKPAACLSIAGPGATNLLTGLWDARVDRIPILALTGQIDTQVLGPGAFQEVDLASAFSSVACWSRTVLDTSNHAELMNLALKNAILQRDVGHLIFPNEVQTLPAPAPQAGSPEGRLPNLETTPPAQSIDQAMELINKADRPAIIVGHGARFRMSGILKLANELGCPVITTFKGKGLIPDSDPLGCGVLGRSGTLVSAHFMNSADLLVVFGASFSQHTGINPDIPTIQVDLDPITLGKFHSVAVPVVGEIGITAELFLKRLKNPACTDRRKEIAAKKAEWTTEKKNRAAKHEGHGLNAAEIFEALSELIPENAVIAVDVGNNTYSFGRYFESKGQPVLMSGYLGSIGFGYPAAMGAWAAAPDRPIVALTGDGGFGQYMGELCTAVKYNMNITHILLNNHELGKISTEQKMAGMTVWETDLHNPSFAEYADICGAKGFRVEKLNELEDAVKAALAVEGPALVEIMSDPELI